MAEKKTKRKPLSKSVRFEVFKRDRFTCQYCGRKAPDVVLEVDHIVPVAKGGTNEIVNLITSCKDCNRGKGKRKLNDAEALRKQQAELEAMADRQEQLRMMAKWRSEMQEFDEFMIEDLCDYFSAITGYDFATATGTNLIRSPYRRFGYDEVKTAIDISVGKYFKDTDWTAANALKKVGGICYNRWKMRSENAEQDNQGKHKDI